MAEETDANGNLIFGDANILNHLLNIKVLEDLANVKLPYHIALKKQDIWMNTTIILNQLSQMHINSKHLYLMLLKDMKI